MNAVKIYTRVESDTPHLPELREFIGKDVEITVIEKEVKKDLWKDIICPVKTRSFPTNTTFRREEIYRDEGHCAQQ